MLQISLQLESQIHHRLLLHFFHVQPLNIWGLPLEGREISMIINGNSTENYASHILKDMEKMVLKMEE